MKKLLVMMLCIATGNFASDVLAQSSYVSFNIGYGLPMNGQTYSSNFIDFSNSTSNGSVQTTEEVKVSLGKGLNLGATFGHMFTPYIGAELGVSYILGGESEAIGTGDLFTSSQKISSNMIRFVPAVVFTAGLETFNPYARLGLIVASSSINYTVYENNEGDILDAELKLNGGVSFGLNAALGATYALNDKMSLFGELNLVSLNYAPKKGEITKYSQDGTDRLPILTVSQIKTDYVDSYTYDFQNPPPDTEPSKELKQYFSYGSIGINFGLKISF